MTHTGCLLTTSDEEMRKNGSVPSGCGANRAIRRCRPRPWSHQSLRPPPRLRPTDQDPSVGAPVLARFSLATLATPIRRCTLAMRLLKPEFANHAHNGLHVLYGRARHDAVAEIEYVPWPAPGGTQNLFDTLFKNF